MGTISLTTVNRLFWLGRYTERIFTTLSRFNDYYDQMIEDDQYYLSFINDFGLENTFVDGKDFVNRFLYDTSLQASLISTLSRAHDNAIILREEITSETLCYLELALSSAVNGKDLESPLYPLIPLKDYLYAFWGSIDDCVASQHTRDLIRIGRYIERIDLYARLDHPLNSMQIEFERLQRRIKRFSNADTLFSKFALDKLDDLLHGSIEYNKSEIINSLASLINESAV